MGAHHRLVLTLLLAGLALPARAGVSDALSTPYPDPAARVGAARAAAADGSALGHWVLAEALLGVHEFADSDREFLRARSAAVQGEDLDLEQLGDLARRLRQRDLRDAAIDVLERRIERALDQVPDAELLSRTERELVSGAIDDLKTVAQLQREQLRWSEFHAARERAVTVAPDFRKATELAEYLDELMWSGQTAHARTVAERFAGLSDDTDVLRKCIEVMILEGQRDEAHRLLRLAVASDMEYWYFRDLLTQYLETFDPGVRWAADRDARLADLLLGRPMAPVDHLLLGAAYHSVGEREREEAAYRDYLDTGGVSPEKLRIAGDLLFEMGKTAEAFLLFQRYLADYPGAAEEPAVLLRVVDCLERTYDLQTSFHGAFNAFGYLFLDERTPQLPVGVFSVLFNDVPLERRLEGLEDALDRYYVDLLAVDLLWNVTRLDDGGAAAALSEGDAEAIRRAYRRLLDYYRRYEDDDRQLQIAEQFIARYADDPEANEFRFEAAAIHHRRENYGDEERAYRAVYEATVPPANVPLPFEPSDFSEQRRVQQHERSFRSLISLYDRDRVARFYDVVALYKLEIDLRGGQLALIDELVRVCDQRSAYDEIEAVYTEAIASYDTMELYDRLARHYLRTQRASEAEKVYRKAKKRFSAQAEPYGWLSNFYADRREYESSEAVLREAVDAFPDDMDWYLQLASVGYRQGGDAGRCGVYREALGRFPHEWRFISGLVTCLPASDDRLSLLEQHQAVVPEAREQMLLEYGERYLIVGRLEAAEAQLAGTPDDALLHRYVGDLYDALSAYEQALEHYEIAARTLTDDPWLLARVGDLRRSFGRHGDAAAAFEALAEMERGGWASRTGLPPGPDGGAAWSPRGPERDPWVVLGEVRAEGGDAPGALSAWRHVIDRDRSQEAGWIEVASACWDYFLFDEAIAVIAEERRTLGDDNLHAKQLAAVHESKRDYRPAIDEYVTILGKGDPMVREDVRIRLVYLARNKGLDKAIRKTFERALREQPGHEGLYRNYADHAARLEDWPAVTSIYAAAQRNVRDRRFLEWVAGEFERLEQAEQAERAFADLARTFASDASAWYAYLGYVERCHTGDAAAAALIPVLTEAHAALPTSGFQHRLIPLLEAREDTGAIDDALVRIADALEGPARFAALTDLAIHRARSGNVDGVAEAFSRQREMRLDLGETPATWSRLAQLEAAMLEAGAEPLAREHLTFLQRDLPLRYETVETWIGLARAWHGAGRTDRELLDRVQAAAPYRVDVAAMIAEQLLAQGDEAAVVTMFEEAVVMVGRLQDTDPAIRAWVSYPSSPDDEVAPAVYGHVPRDTDVTLASYGHNPFGDILGAGNAAWLHGGYDYGYYGEYAYDYEAGYHGGYGHDYEYGYEGYHEGGYPSADPATHGKRARRLMRRDLRRALVETVVPRGMRYDGVTAYERMVNEDPLDADLLAEAWRFASLHGYGEQFRGYYADVQREAGRDFRWYRVMARLAATQGDLASEADWLEKLLRVEPQRTDVHRELAAIYRRLGRDAEALEHLDRVRFLSEDEVGYLREVAELAYDTGDAERGRRELLRIQALGPDDIVVQHQLVTDLTRFGETEAAVGVARAFLGGAPDEARAERDSMYFAWIDVHLRAGQPSQARDVWWKAHADTQYANAEQFSLIYTAPGMRTALVRDFEARQETVITDTSVRNRFLELFAAEHLYREEAALRTLVVDAQLLRGARKVGEVFGPAPSGRRSPVPQNIRRALLVLEGDDHRSIHRRVSETPSASDPDDPGGAHARAIAALLGWENSNHGGGGPTGVPNVGLVSHHPDVRTYGADFDRGHRSLAGFYRERRLFLDAAAELRRIEVLYGPLRGEVYKEQLDLLGEQIAAGVDVERAERERARIHAAVLEETAAELAGWPAHWRDAREILNRFSASAMLRYLQYTASSGDAEAFAVARERTFVELGVVGPYGAGAPSSEIRRIFNLLGSINAASTRGPLELAEATHRRSIELMPEEVAFQRDHLDLLTGRSTQDRVMAAVEERLTETGRLWIYRWACAYLQREGDLAAALAMVDRGVDAFPGDVDLRLARIDVLVEAELMDRAAAEARFLVGDQTVGGFLQGAALAAGPVAPMPPDQLRTAIANHTYHLLTPAERERLFTVYAAGTGDEGVLAYLAERHPRRVEAYESMARAAQLGGHHDLALQCLDRAALLVPEDPARFLGQRGEIHWAAGDRSAARRAWAALAEEPYPEAVQEAFDLLWERDQHAEAVQMAATQVVNRRGFDPAGGGQGSSIVAWAAGRIEATREYDLLGSLYLGIAPALHDPSRVADMTAHLRTVHRPELAEQLLAAVLEGLEPNAQRSVLYSEAALARQQGRPDREAEILDRLIGLEPDDVVWRSLRTLLAVETGDAGAVDRVAGVLEHNLHAGGLRDGRLATALLVVLARSEVSLSPADADRLRSVLGDERYDPWRAQLVFPLAEIELAAGRPEQAVQSLREALGDHPSALDLWAAASETLAGGGAPPEACALRAEQATHLITYQPADPDALFLKARSEACAGDPTRAAATAAEVVRLNPGLPTVQLDRARFLLEIGESAASLEAALAVRGPPDTRRDATLLAGDAALAAGQPAALTEGFGGLYGAALTDARGADALVTLAAWAAAEDHPARAETLLPALRTLAVQREIDPRPDRLAAALYRGLDRGGEGEAALRRSLERAPNHPRTQVHLLDLLLAPERPEPAALAEARDRTEELAHQDPQGCDVGRLRFRIAVAGEAPDAWSLASRVSGLACAGITDLERAEEVLVDAERYSDAVRAVDRLIQLDPARADGHRERRERHIAAHEAQGKEVSR